MAVSCHAIIIIVVVVTFAKEVVFYEAFVCLSLFVFVCLFVCQRFVLQASLTITNSP